MAGLWPLRLRSLHADFCDCERVSAADRPHSHHCPLKAGTITESHHQKRQKNRDPSSYSRTWIS
ncbi:hypothetical protein F5976_12060 [Lacticaseibacillus rhamnosus]|nr:hypothetical protein F5976_12060 [Lacticaseibacillus rhamnosus]